MPSTLVRNLGVIFDNRMTMRDQITALCRTAHFHLRNIGRIRKSITDDACEKLIHAFVTTRLDCGNANLYDLPDNQLHLTAWQSTTSNRKVGSYYTCSKTTSLATNISTHRLQDSTSNIQGAAWFSSSIYFQAHKATSYRSQYQINGYKQTSSTSNESSYFWW